MLVAGNSIIFIIQQFLSKKSTQLGVDFLKIFFKKVISKGSLSILSSYFYELFQNKTPVDITQRFV